MPGKRTGKDTCMCLQEEKSLGNKTKQNTLFFFLIN